MLKAILPLTEDNIFYKTNDYSIFKFYCNKFIKIGTHFKSPLRVDPDPSAIISYYNGRLLFRDFGLRLTLYPIQYVMYAYRIDYINALKKINSDLHLGLEGDTVRIKSPYIRDVDLSNFKDDVKTQIKISNISHNSDSINYWNIHGWNHNMLIEAKIRNIDAFWIYKHDKYFFDTKHELSFSYDYYWRNGSFLRKIYLPFGKNRFFTNADNTIIQGWDLLPKNGGEDLFITSSLKDIGPFWRLNNTCNSIAPNSETSFIPEDIFYTKIKPRWENIYLWMDNDSTGIRSALKWAQMYGITPIWNPIGAPKDPSDYTVKYGLREFNYLKTNLLKL